MKKNADKGTSTTHSYVDRDRAAATASLKDIKSELKVISQKKIILKINKNGTHFYFQSKKKRERIELLGTGPKNCNILDEDVDKETYVLQGEHELKY